MSNASTKGSVVLSVKHAIAIWWEGSVGSTEQCLVCWVRLDIDTLPRVGGVVAAKVTLFWNNLAFKLLCFCLWAVFPLTLPIITSSCQHILKFKASQLF